MPEDLEVALDPEAGSLESLATRAITHAADTLAGYFSVTAGAAGGLSTGTNTWTSNVSSFLGAVSGNSYAFGSAGLSVMGYGQRQIEMVREDYRALRMSRARKKAEDKARRLFIRVVGESAWLDFKESRYHEIVSPSGVRYRLRPGLRVQKMIGYDGSMVEIEYCAHMPFGIPWWDTMVVQHLMLTASRESEAKFLAVANRHDPLTKYPIPELDRNAGLAA